MLENAERKGKVGKERKFGLQLALEVLQLFCAEAIRKGACAGEGIRLQSQTAELREGEVSEEVREEYSPGAGGEIDSETTNCCERTGYGGRALIKCETEAQPFQARAQRETHFKEMLLVRSEVICKVRQLCPGEFDAICDGKCGVVIVNRRTTEARAVLEDIEGCAHALVLERQNEILQCRE